MRESLFFRRRKRKRVVSWVSEALDDASDFRPHNLPESVIVGSPDLSSFSVMGSVCSLTDAVTIGSPASDLIKDFG